MGGLENDVLVLNRLWQAVNIVPARRALTLLFVGRGKVVDRDFGTFGWDRWADLVPDEREPTVHGVDLEIRLPRVIQLTEFARVPRPSVRFTRTNVYLRDGHRCQYCGERARHRELTLDHVQPRSRGGPTNWRNIVVSCVRCNARKRDRNPEEAGMQLLREPRKPRWHPATALRPVAKPHPDWIPFLSWAPATVVGEDGGGIGLG